MTVLQNITAERWIPGIHAMEQIIAPMPDTSRIKLEEINTLATSYEAVNNYVRAVEAFRKVIRLSLPLQDSSILANAFVNTDTVYNEIGNDTLAIYYTLEAVPYLSEPNPVLFTAYSNLTNYHAGIGRTGDAWRYLNKKNRNVYVRYGFSTVRPTLVLPKDGLFTLFSKYRITDFFLDLFNGSGQFSLIHVPHH